MSETQYIGSRYVPKFYENSVDPDSIEWEAGVAYAPLTIVSYQSDTYTSKTSVPASIGNPSSNAKYWARTGEYNALIGALQNEVADAKDDIKILKIFKDNGLSMISDYVFTKDVSVENPTNDGKTNIQGAAYNSNTNKLLVGFINNSETECVLVLFDNDGTTIVDRATFDNLGHCNDITYNPRTRKYYVCSSKTPPNIQTNTIVEINEDLTYSRTITLTTAEIVGNIAYDFDNDRYIGQGATKMYIFNSSFSLIEENDNINWRNLINNDGNNSYTLYNGMTMYNGFLYIATFKANASDNGQAGFNIIKYDIDNKVISECNIFTQSTPISEIEGLFVMNDDLYAIIGGGRWYGMARLIFQNKPYLRNGDNALFAGRNIPANSDLNDYLTAGKYFFNTDYVATLSHAPFTTGNGALYVISAGQSTVIQIAERIDTYPCFNYRVYSGNTWGRWFNIGAIAHKGLEEKIQNFLVPAFVTGGGTELNLCLPFGDCTDLTMANISSLTFSITARYEGTYLSDGVNTNVIKSANANVTEKFASKQGIRVRVKRADGNAFINGQNNYSLTCDIDATLNP